VPAPTTKPDPVMVSGWAVAPWARVDGLIRLTVGWASMVVALTALTALKVTPVPEAVTLGAVAGGTAHPLPEITTANDLAPWPMAWGDGERSRRRARFAECL
jgi:hypothetical protein